MDLWQYTSPAMVASASLAHRMDTSGPVLDCGCGTGLSGQALAHAGFQQLHGCDISPVSLEQIQSVHPGLYSTLKEVDLNQCPLPYQSDQFSGTVCVGVLWYVKDIPGLFKEWTRVNQNG